MDVVGFFVYSLILFSISSSSDKRRPRTESRLIPTRIDHWTESERQEARWSILGLILFFLLKLVRHSFVYSPHYSRHRRCCCCCFCCCRFSWGMDVWKEINTYYTLDSSLHFVLPASPWSTTINVDSTNVPYFDFIVGERERERALSCGYDDLWLLSLVVSLFLFHSPARYTSSSQKCVSPNTWRTLLLFFFPVALTKWIGNSFVRKDN